MQPAVDEEFWRMATVVQKTGLSKSELYRRIDAGEFPKSRTYPGSAKIKFWLATEIRKWQAEILASVG